jgi:folate-dependent phosphoribosylglycinamide formyltransferase PurN
VVGIVAITGNGLRHRWAVWQLAQDPRLELLGVVRERKRALPSGATAEEDALLRSHFAERQAAESRHFGTAPELAALGAPVLDVEFGHSNDPEVADWVAARSPRLLQLFGCSIIRAPLLERYAARTVNIHLGLSPYYRGAATNFWPLVNGEPELVGATIHLATPAVDAGPILRQARPEIDAEDGAHAVGCRALAAGIAALRDALPAYASGELEPVPQAPGVRLYKNADFDARAVARLRERLAHGMLREYLDDAEARRARFPIVT